MIGRIGLILLLSLALALNVSCESEKIVQTANGLVRGQHEISQREKVGFYAFRGIPYAKPPLGELRFKAPEPVDSWAPNVYDALRYSNNCIQPIQIYNDSSPQHEDCLYLNIYAPSDIQANETLAVMFFIHGGGYAEGSGNNYSYGPDFLIENRVILVTSNYRLGVLGFLSLGLPEYSGNMGLKDQQLALKWIHQNIEQFGGDNKRITIFGQSAGGACTQLHLLSNESQKYFHNGILMSGTAYSYWALFQKQNHTAEAFKMAADWKEPQQNLTSLLHVLKSVSAAQFVEYSQIPLGLSLGLKFAPVIENSNAVQPFLLERPEKALEHLDVYKNAMFGFTSQEWKIFPISPEFKENFNLVLPFNGAPSSVDSPKYLQLRAEVQDFYFKNVSVLERPLEDYITLASDINFAYFSGKAAKEYSKKSINNTFFYHFAVESKLNVFKRSRGFAGGYGAIHGDDLFYLFTGEYGESYLREVYDSEADEQSKISLNTIKEYTQLFTSFAKNGIPSFAENNTNVPPFENNRLQYVDITNQGLKNKENLRKKMLDFWANIEQRALDGSDENTNEIKRNRGT